MGFKILALALALIALPQASTADKHCGWWACPQPTGPTGPIMPLPDIYKPVTIDELGERR